MESSPLEILSLAAGLLSSDNKRKYSQQPLAHQQPQILSNLHPNQHGQSSSLLSTSSSSSGSVSALGLGLTPQQHLPAKLEVAVEEDDDQPLDFSCKKRKKEPLDDPTEPSPSVPSSSSSSSLPATIIGYDQNVLSPGTLQRVTSFGHRPSVISFAHQNPTTLASTTGMSPSAVGAYLFSQPPHHHLQQLPPIAHQHFSSHHHMKKKKPMKGIEDNHHRHRQDSSEDEGAEVDLPHSKPKFVKRKGNNKKTVKVEKNRRIVVIGENCVDEHFRRSLGEKYDERSKICDDQPKISSAAASSDDATNDEKPPKLVKKENNDEEEASSSSTSSTAVTSTTTTKVDGGLLVKPASVDDHFAKALGTETWRKINSINTTTTDCTKYD